MKICLKTFEAEGTPEEIIELVMLYEQKHAPRKCPEPNLTVTLDTGKRKPGRPRTRPIDWVRAEQLHAAGWADDLIAAELGATKEAIKERFADDGSGD